MRLTDDSREVFVITHRTREDRVAGVRSVMHGWVSGGYDTTEGVYRCLVTHFSGGGLLGEFPQSELWMTRDAAEQALMLGLATG